MGLKYREDWARSADPESTGRVSGPHKPRECRTYSPDL
jgi:hypothetical protein